MRIRFSIIILIFFSNSVLFAQVTGEWIMQDYPESDISDVSQSKDGIYILMHSIHDLEDTNQFHYNANVFRLEFVEPKDDISLVNVYNSNTGTYRRVAIRLTNIADNWLLTESTFLAENKDTFYLHKFDQNFGALESLARPIHAELSVYCSINYGNGEYAGIGTVFEPPDSLVSVRYSSDSQGSPQIKVFRTEPSISFVTSMTYDSLRNRFLVFHLGGISHLNDTFGMIQRYPGGLIHTSQHGTVVADDLRYYSFGASAFQGSPEFRDLVFQQYDTSMQIMFADTFGRSGKDDYPFINQSLDECNSNFYIGGMLAGPSNFNNRDTLKFFMAKYNQDLDRLWYREYGGSHSYVIRGLTGLPDGRCLVYGYRVDNEDGLRYPYLLIVNEDGQITSSKDVSKPEPQLFQILYTTESENITITSSQEIDELQLFSLDGKSIARYQNILPGNHDFNLAYLPPGVYVFLAASGKERQSRKWVKR